MSSRKPAPPDVLIERVLLVVCLVGFVLGLRIVWAGIVDPAAGGLVIVGSVILAVVSCCGLSLSSMRERRKDE